MKKIYAISGVARTGKTSIINDIYYKLIENSSNVDILEFKGRRDIRAIIEVKGILIGIECQGDPSSRQPKSLEHFKNKNCEIIIVASRTRGDTKIAIKNMKNFGYEIFWYHSFKEENFKNQNNTIKQSILKEIDFLL